MSCYLLAPTDPDKHIVRVGWESSAKSFFVYISRPVFSRRGGRPNKDAGETIKSRGIDVSDQLSLEDLERELEGYAELTPEVRSKLLRDQQGDPDSHEAVKEKDAA